VTTLPVTQRAGLGPLPAVAQVPLHVNSARGVVPGPRQTPDTEARQNRLGRMRTNGGDGAQRPFQQQLGRLHRLRAAALFERGVAAKVQFERAKA
jgi:hypothetical protein